VNAASKQPMILVVHTAATKKRWNAYSPVHVAVEKDAGNVCQQDEVVSAQNVKSKKICPECEEQ
jgi:hypothetical protein